MPCAFRLAVSWKGLPEAGIVFSGFQKAFLFSEFNFTGRLLYENSRFLHFQIGEKKTKWTSTTSR